MSNLSQFNFVQNVFTLNLFSNFASGKKAPAEELQQDLAIILNALFADSNLQQTIGTWQVVWGPVVGSYGIDVKRGAASNAMYVAQNQNGQYVIGVSATNPTSLYGWFTEDFDVRNMISWKQTLATAGANGLAAAEATTIGTATDIPHISIGTYDGISHLLALVSPVIQPTGGAVVPPTPTTLMQFLEFTFANNTTPTQLVVSGHSLGGALSPTLALYINEWQSQWNAAGTVVVSTMPTAGATPGNQAFSNYQNSRMGLRTLRFWNKLDPVPHGWQPDLLEQVPFLYYPYIKPGVLMKGITALALAQSLEGTSKYPAGGFYTPLQPQAPPLPGQVNLDFTGTLSAQQVLQMLVDIGVEEILSLFHKNSLLQKDTLLTPLIVEAINWVLKTFENQEDLDTLMQHLEEKLSHLPDSAGIEKILEVLYAILLQLENVIVYLTQLAFQHVTSYPYLMETSSIHELTQSIINNLVLKGKLTRNYNNLLDNLNNPVLLVTQMAGAVGNLIEKATENDVNLLKNIIERQKLGLI